MSFVTLISKDMTIQVTEAHAERIMKIQKAMRSKYWTILHETPDVTRKSDKRPRPKKAE